MRRRSRDRDERALRRFNSEQPFSRIFPNLITIAGLCCGLSAVRWAMLGKWELAVAFIFAAAIIDGMDGRIARLLGATSVFGAQLDSLSDFVCFGIAPALVMYHWQLHEVRGVGWAVVLFYAICAALRLARFNTGISRGTEKPQWQKRFFTGVPSPAGGIMALWPLIVFLQTEHSVELSKYYTLVHLFVIGLLMASRFPTFAAKNFRIKPDLILPVTVTCAFVLVLFIIEPWWVASVGTILYLIHIPFCYLYYLRLQAKHTPVTVVDEGSSVTELKPQDRQGHR